MDVQGIVVQFSTRITDLCSVHSVQSVRSSKGGEKHRILYTVSGVHITSLLSGRRDCKNGRPLTGIICGCKVLTAYELCIIGAIYPALLPASSSPKQII